MGGDYPMNEDTIYGYTRHYYTIYQINNFKAYYIPNGDRNIELENTIENHVDYLIIKCLMEINKIRKSR